MWIAAQNEGNLRIIDFGGSLGSTYFQNKRFLDSLKTVSWNIVEQPSFVQVGMDTFQNDVLKFYFSIRDAVKSSANTDAVLFSSVLQYLESPFKVLKEAAGLKIPYIIIDRTGFTLNDAKSRITVQKVPEKIYSTSYPCWFFNEKEFLHFFESADYELIADFDALDVVNIPSVYKGFIFRLK
jgi:putative methyltransferase (TIGR04325 family)